MPRGFYGHWVLKPGKSSYGFGKPPARGTYDIEALGDGFVRFTSRWWSASGREHVIDWAGRLDGESYPYTSTRLADFLRFRQVSSHLIVSEAQLGDRVVYRAERELLDDQTLRVSLHGDRPPHGTYTNTDLYRRG